ncbi:MAG: type 4a pilus biogenesis protein PilO [Deltaproteobacteria bacterium]|nr:type 4a pilus biogenesis protein PilO [Deltaproteobacteria bacterium]
MISPALIENVEKIRMPYRVLILVGVLVLLMSVFVFFIYHPKTAEISTIKKAISKLDREINAAKARAKNADKFEAELAMVDAQFREALKLLPNKREIPHLLKSITQQGSESNLEFLLFSPKRERPRNFYVEIPVSVEVRGEYHDVARFFDKVGRMERIVNMLEVSMKPAKTLGTDLVTKCVAVTYRFKEGKPDAGKAKKRRKKRSKKKAR